MSRPARLLAASAIAATIGGCSSSPPPAQTAPVQTAAATVEPPKREPGVNVLWRYRIGHPLFPSVTHLVANPKGEIALAASAGDQALVFRFDPTGRFLWRTGLTSFRNWLWDAAIDEQGNVYGTAWFDSDVTIGGRSITEGVTASVYLLKLDSAGNKAWSRVLRGDGVEDPSLSLVPGGVLLAGSFSGDLHLGGVLLAGGGTGARQLIGGNLFVARFDAEGQSQWASEISGRAAVTEIFADSSGRFLLAGDCWDDIAFDTSSPFKCTIPRDDDRGHFLAQLDASGKVKWTRRVDVGRVMQREDASGEMQICTGSGSGPQTLKKMAADGQVLATVTLRGVGPRCRQLALDGQSSAYVVATGEGPDGKDLVHRLDEKGKVVSSMPLFPSPTEFGPVLLWAGGRLLAAGIDGTHRDDWSIYLAEVTL